MCRSKLNIDLEHLRVFSYMYDFVGFVYINNRCAIGEIED